MSDLKLGRRPRQFDPRIPTHHLMKAMLRQAGVTRPPLPATLDNAFYLPADLGMMGNDVLGDCTCAGIYHFVQLATRDAQGTELTEPDMYVEALYADVTGYDGTPGDATDQGAAEQTVLAYAMNTGIPLSDGTRHRLTSYVEADVRNLDDVCEVIAEFGAAYIGFEVPAGFMESGPPEVWDASASYGPIEGGHCVLLTGFDRTDPVNPIFNVISWGSKQWRMTAAFFRQYVDEVYGLVSTYWIEKTGDTPYGMTLAQLEALGDALRGASQMETHADHGADEAARFGIARSSHWPTVEREYKEDHPTCAAGGDGPVQVHHKKVSFHVAKLLGRGDLELTPSNLISLTESADETKDGLYHLYLGHGDNFQHDCNPHVDEDVVSYRGVACPVIKADPVWQAHAAACPPPWDRWTRAMKIARRQQLDAEFPVDGPECVNVVARFPGCDPVPLDEWLAALPE